MRTELSDMCLGIVSIRRCGRVNECRVTAVFLLFYVSLLERSIAAASATAVRFTEKVRRCEAYPRQSTRFSSCLGVLSLPPHFVSTISLSFLSLSYILLAVSLYTHYLLYLCPPVLSIVIFGPFSSSFSPHIRFLTVLLSHGCLCGGSGLGV